MEHRRLCQLETRKLLSVLGIIVIGILVLETLMLPNIFEKILLHEKKRVHMDYSLRKSTVVNNVPLLNKSKMINPSVVLEVAETTEVVSIEEEFGHDSETKGKKRDLRNDVVLRNEQGSDNLSRLADDGGADFEKFVDLDKNFPKEIVGVPRNDSAIERGKELERGSSTTNGKTIHLFKEEKPLPLQDGSSISNSSMIICNMPPKTVMTISEMNSLLLRRRASAGFAKSQWLSVRDKELLSARLQIQNAPIIRNDGELYAPLFRNVSMFKRSYELMERILKVYVYREGEKPIFHQPILKGLYSSEGWFMKLMEANKQFVVKDRKKAHLFYMPFSSRILKNSIYVPNSHDWTNLAAYLRNYTNMIAAKYPVWNRTGGADHFFVACHDWAPYETRHHMERCVKSMCNADVTQGFKIGKDVSFPETYVRSARNPVRDIGGEPPSNRSILAFFAGSMHGYLRPILLSHWKNKDPDMKIFGRMPLGVASKMNYIRHMKNSKYCICAKGYEVNSPRIVESMFYECVPVILSDNFVPPFFDVLNWDAFSVFVAEKDIPNLKNILLSIPYEKYLAMQLAVRKAQRHFVWHSKPEKYDLFSMTLHSIWYNRVFMIKAK